MLAQVLSRLLVVLAVNTIVYALADGLLAVPMQGAYWVLGLVYTASALCLIILGLIVAARLRNEELADGLLNLISWPMLLFSGVWFSLEGANPIAQGFAQLLPLTHLVNAARAVMLDGAGFIEVWP
ncbi:ABC transporter permease [Caldichromatium japonicum]|uniref:ABC transporter permease n=1 Tax=Caldichromatium japonicum TaxID=2699430 RepID=UPI0031B61D85